MSVQDLGASSGFSDDLPCVYALFERLFLALQNGSEESVGLVFCRIEAQVFADVQIDFQTGEQLGAVEEFVFGVFG